METEKKVDETWKARVREEKSKEKAAAPPGGTKEAPDEKQAVSGEPLPEPDFSTFISGLGMQALLFLGELPVPQGEDKIKPDYQQAKYIIDLIDMLGKKTEGNLAQEETSLIENLLYDLRMRYLKHV